MYIERLYQKYLESGKISTDTRQITPHSVFFALKGEKFNANEFAAEALTLGAKYAVVDDERFANGDRYILVKDSLDALQRLAKHHRSQLKIPVIGLTGSNGKTTTKELLNAVLSRKFRTLATKGNLNNHIGVPLTILSIDKEIEIAIVEMGANHLGEIALLSSIANPTHGFVTNIGKAHIGTFGGFENIVRSKSELYQHLIQNEGIVFINSQDPILSNMAKRFKAPLAYPSVGDYYSCELIEADPFVKLRTEDGEMIQTQIVGGYNFENIAVALCLGKYFGVKANLANKAVAEYVPGNMRSQVLKKGTNTIILDAYNANPSSMQAAIDNLASMNAGRKVAILGDMFELEAEADKEHRYIGQLLKEKKFECVYLCGKLMRSASEELSQALFFETKDELMEELKRNPIVDATVLVKASRGVGLETVVDVI
ncbi:MAG: UDP-N-acetylmuramoyl-tripeptide--D-alanyl-D-alanine ligase [Bacteroidia bacterium]|nr:UDP-N-acetylmuramoyl-tripeptide--D-alanyl-D-alanine ligase [Bacteroidia bacterium]